MSSDLITLGDRQKGPSVWAKGEVEETWDTYPEKETNLYNSTGLYMLPHATQKATLGEEYVVGT